MILSVPGTPFYIPPEYIRTGLYDGCQATVWQLGVILMEMLPEDPEDLSPGIYNLCEVNPSQRSYISACLQKLQRQFLDINRLSVL